MSNLNFEEQIKNRRTFAIISHPDAGKTTLTEKLLLFSGAILNAGTVKAKKSGKFATSDWMEIEKQRGISVASSVMQFEYLGHTINLLDTPGHQDFSEDTYRVLTAVDCALMVIDATKGVEEQTIKLLEVCRLRNTPIITFLNKYDRETRNSIELLDEIENILKINCSPITWPIGMGKNFRGVFNLLDNQLSKYNPKKHEVNNQDEIIEGLENKKLDELYPMEIDDLRSDIELLKEASYEFKKEDFLQGKITPIFCGSAINNFGIKEILDSLVAWAPSPKPKQTLTRIVNPNEKEFSGFVFKIQANMDPKHRDRIAFLRICSGKFTKGMKIKHIRLNKEINANNIVTFMSHNRDIIDEAFAGDIIGIPNHGNIQIGDSFSENESLIFTGIPFFAPELFKKIYIKNPLKTKQLYKGLQQLGEEGAVQVFKPLIGNDLIIGAIGVLQFEVVSARLKNEYNVDIQYENCNTWSARWVNSDNPNKLAEFEKNNSNNLSIDAGGNLTYLVPNRVNLQLTEERWPEINFYKTREHSIKV